MSIIILLLTSLLLTFTLSFGTSYCQAIDRIFFHTDFQNIELANVETRKQNYQLSINKATYQSNNNNLNVIFNLTNQNYNFVSNLQPYMLKVTDTGKRIYNFDLKKTNQIKQDQQIVFVLDISGSMIGDPYQESFQAIKKFVTDTKGNDNYQFAGVVFSAEIADSEGFVTDEQELLRIIDKFSANISNASTSLYDATAQAIKLFDEHQYQKSIIILSDGGENTSTYTHNQVLSLAKNKNINLITVGIKGTSFDMQAENRLKSLSGSTGGYYLLAEKIDDITEVYQKIFNSLSQQYFISYQVPPGSLMQKQVKIELKTPSHYAYDTKSYFIYNRPYFIPLSDIKLNENLSENNPGSGVQIEDPGNNKKTRKEKTNNPCDGLARPYNKTYSSDGEGVAEAARDLFEFATKLTKEDEDAITGPARIGYHTKFKCGPHHGKTPETGNTCGADKDQECSSWGPYDEAIPSKAREMYDISDEVNHPKNSIDYLQCVSFVAMVYNMVDESMINDNNTFSNGGQWHNKDFVCAYDNGNTKRLPELGMGIDMPGHVGVIGKYDDKDKEITIKEANTPFTDREFTINVADDDKITLKPKGSGNITWYFEKKSFVEERCKATYVDNPEDDKDNYDLCLDDPCKYANDGSLNNKEE